MKTKISEMKSTLDMINRLDILEKKINLKTKQ